MMATKTNNDTKDLIKVEKEELMTFSNFFAYFVAFCCGAAESAWTESE